MVFHKVRSSNGSRNRFFGSISAAAVAQMSSTRRSTSRLADIRLQLGWMMVLAQHMNAASMHMGYAYGNRPEARSSLNQWQATDITGTGW